MSVGPALVQVSVEVAVDAATAFEIYTTAMGRWWPPEHHIGEAELADVIVEPRAGGRIHETGVDGTECDWGTVLTWDPPHRLVYAWQLNGRWEHDADLDRASEVEITFDERADDMTTVTLVHRNFQRHGPDGAGIAASVAGDEGWPVILGRYRDLAAAALHE